MGAASEGAAVGKGGGAQCTEELTWPFFTVKGSNTSLRARGSFYRETQGSSGAHRAILSHAGVMRFRKPHDPIDTTTPQGMFSLQMPGAVAQLERALIAEHITRCAESLPARGLPDRHPRARARFAAVEVRRRHWPALLRLPLPCARPRAPSRRPSRRS